MFTLKNYSLKNEKKWFKFYSLKKKERKPAFLIYFNFDCLKSNVWFIRNNIIIIRLEIYVLFY